MARDYKAERERRKARLAAEGTTLFKRRTAAAKRIGYKSLGDLRKRRAAGDLTPLDTARQAPIVGVSDIGGDRFTFRADSIDPMSRAELGRAVHQAQRAPVEMRATISVDWNHPSGRTGTAAAGGSSGIDVDRLARKGDVLDSIEDELGLVGGSEMPPGAQIVAISVFFFPVGEAA